MNVIEYDAVVIGAGAAGMAAAIALRRRGHTCALIDREDSMGGILVQCIHDGFGLQHFGEALTGPEFAERLERDVRAAGVPFFPETTVLSMVPLARGKAPGTAGTAGAAGVTEATAGDNKGYSLLLSSARDGVREARCRAVILATGSRERNRGNVRIAGDRPAGVFTAGLAQRLINVEGRMPGRRAVIIGSGDIGLIMARRLVLSGAEVAAVVEIQPYPSGLPRNIAQCLDDFSIPLYLSHATTRIIGRDRVSGVEIAPIENGAPDAGRAFVIDCDTVLLSVGLVPETELPAKAGVSLHSVTGGPEVDADLMTNLPGVFAAGNVLQIHDLVDRVAEEAARAGDACADWLEADPGVPPPVAGATLAAGANVRYVVPSRTRLDGPTRVSLRALAVIEDCVLRCERAGTVVLSRNVQRARPGEMIVFDLPAVSVAMSVAAAAPDRGAPVTVSLVPRVREGGAR